jgi:glucose/arabinose dehydrogenase
VVVFFHRQAIVRIKGRIFIRPFLVKFAIMQVKAAFIGLAILLFQDGLPPVETKPGFANYKPAFVGQTRIAGSRTTTPYKVDKIANNLGNPFAIVTMPDGRLMITLKSGTMEIHDKNGGLVKKITGLPEVVYAGQGGLLDVGSYLPKTGICSSVWVRNLPRKSACRRRS